LEGAAAPLFEFKNTLLSQSKKPDQNPTTEKKNVKIVTVTRYSIYLLKVLFYMR